MSDIVTRARELLAEITRGPWQWNDYRVPDLIGRAGEQGVYEYDTEVLEASHSGECGCRSSCELELAINAADKAFIAAAPQLVGELADEVEQLRGDLDFYRGWSNDLTQYIPEEFDDDIAQEAIISHWASSVSSEVERLRKDYLKAIQDLEFHAGLLHNAENVAEWMREAARQHRVRLEAAHG